MTATASTAAGGTAGADASSSENSRPSSREGQGPGGSSRSSSTPSGPLPPGVHIGVPVGMNMKPRQEYQAVPRSAGLSRGSTASADGQEALKSNDQVDTGSNSRRNNFPGSVAGSLDEANSEALRNSVRQAQQRAEALATRIAQRREAEAVDRATSGNRRGSGVNRQSLTDSRRAQRAAEIAEERAQVQRALAALAEVERQTETTAVAAGANATTGANNNVPVNPLSPPRPRGDSDDSNSIYVGGSDTSPSVLPGSSSSSEISATSPSSGTGSGASSATEEASSPAGTNLVPSSSTTGPSPGRDASRAEGPFATTSELRSTGNLRHSFQRNSNTGAAGPSGAAASSDQDAADLSAWPTSPEPQGQQQQEVSEEASAGGGRAGDKHKKSLAISEASTTVPSGTSSETRGNSSSANHAWEGSAGHTRGSLDSVDELEREDSDLADVVSESSGVVRFGGASRCGSSINNRRWVGAGGWSDRTRRGSATKRERRTSGKRRNGGPNPARWRPSRGRLRTGKCGVGFTWSECSDRNWTVLQLQLTGKRRQC